MLNKEFDADDDEITRTRKIRRRFVAEKYAAIVEAFYSGADEVEVSAAITYEDGRKAVLRSTIAIADVDDPDAGRARPSGREPCGGGVADASVPQHSRPPARQGSAVSG